MSTYEELHRFLNAAAGEGLMMDGVDAADLYTKIFPDQYQAALEGGTMPVREPGPAMTHPVISTLVEVAKTAFWIADDAVEQVLAGSDRTFVVDEEDYEKLVAALDQLDSLPDDCPGVHMGPSAKAEWALRNVKVMP